MDERPRKKTQDTKARQGQLIYPVGVGFPSYCEPLAALTLTAGTIALATLRPIAAADRRLALIAILAADPLLAAVPALYALALAVLTIPALWPDAIPLSVLALAINPRLLTVLLVLVAFGTEARMRGGEHDES